MGRPSSFLQPCDFETGLRAAGAVESWQAQASGRQQVIHSCVLRDGGSQCSPAPLQPPPAAAASHKSGADVLFHSRQKANKQRCVRVCVCV